MHHNIEPIDNSSNGDDRRNNGKEETDSESKPSSSMAYALSMIRKRREIEQRAKEENDKAQEEKRKEKAREKRRRRRQNQRKSKQRIKAANIEVFSQDGERAPNQKEDDADSKDDRTTNKQSSDPTKGAIYEGIDDNDTDSRVSSEKALKPRRKRSKLDKSVRDKSSDKKSIAEAKSPTINSTVNEEAAKKLRMLIPRALLVKKG